MLSGWGAQLHSGGTLSLNKGFGCTQAAGAGSDRAAMTESWHRRGSAQRGESARKRQMPGSRLTAETK
jgi:hypothetical protein